jgi:hypothetical protein
VRNQAEIKAELEGAIARRAELWDDLNEGHDPAKSAEAAQLTARIADLWSEYRNVRARLRHGPVEQIHARARAEERLEREAKRLRQAA